MIKTFFQVQVDYLFGWKLPYSYGRRIWLISVYICKTSMKLKIVWFFHNLRSLSYNTCRKIATNREWCGSLKFYTTAQQTWAVENFFSHTLLHYCPKQNANSYDSYSIRNMLAVMDHNYHKERDVATTPDGNPYVQGQVSRRTKMWVAYERWKVKEFSNIPGNILAMISWLESITTIIEFQI